eukprot:1924022-Rhodomonas_salina.1
MMRLGRNSYRVTRVPGYPGYRNPGTRVPGTRVGYPWVDVVAEKISPFQNNFGDLSRFHGANLCCFGEISLFPNT